MGITIFGRGIPLSAVDDGTTLNIAYGGTAICDITTSGLSATAAQVNATTLTATTVQGTKLCGSTAASAVNIACTFGGGGSATICAGTPQAISADRFLVMSINGKTMYIPAFCSASSLSAC